MTQPEHQAQTLHEPDHGGEYQLIFARFERFWHWAQSVLVLVLMVTGARLHGPHEAGQWGSAFRVHLIAAGLIIVLWVFAIFWHFTTGQWRQYLPTGQGLFAVMRFYAWGIFRGEAHPYKLTVQRKLNPLQRMSYLFLKLIINPAIWISGVLYATNNLTGLELQPIAWVHVMAAWAMAVFLIIHVYMITTGCTVTEHLKAMITGYEWVETGRHSR